jgi:hypothetical protein
MLIEALELHEYNVRKYRTRVDSRAEQGNLRSSTEYHALASDESKRVRDLMGQLGDMLGPDGGPGLPIAGVLRLAAKQAEFLASVEDIDSFEAACFFRRHPNWAQKSTKHLEAHRRWFETPALEAMAPEYLPIWSSWTE